MEYLEEFQGSRPQRETVKIDGREYVRAEALQGTDTGYRYYPDKNLCVLVPAAVWAGNQPKSRTY